MLHGQGLILKDYYGPCWAQENLQSQQQIDGTMLSWGLVVGCRPGRRACREWSSDDSQAFSG